MGAPAVPAGMTEPAGLLEPTALLALEGHLVQREPFQVHTTRQGRRGNHNCRRDSRCPAHKRRAGHSRTPAYSRPRYQAHRAWWLQIGQKYCPPQRGLPVPEQMLLPGSIVSGRVTWLLPQPEPAHDNEHRRWLCVRPCPSQSQYGCWIRQRTPGAPGPGSCSKCALRWRTDAKLSHPDPRGQVGRRGKPGLEDW